MKQKLLITALGIALTGGMGYAAADTQLYGQLDMSIDSEDVDGGQDDVNMGANRSAVGIKGSEDLGAVDAIYQVEWQVDLDDADQARSSFNEDESGGGFVGRDQWLGLGGGFGKLRFGAISTAYKSPGSAIDPMYRTRIQSRNVGLQSTLHKGKGEEGQGRATNTIRYDTPNWGGVSLTGTYTIDNDEDDDGSGVAGDSAADENDNPYSVGAQFKNDMFLVFASYLTTDRGGDDDATQLGFKFSTDMFALRGIYEFDGGLVADNIGAGADGSTGGNGDGTGGDDGADLYSVGVDGMLGSAMVSLDYGHRDDNDGDDGVANTADDLVEQDIWRLAAQYKFSQQTKVYVGWANVDYDTAGGSVEDDIVTLGMRHNF
jgi:predicted porin